LRAIWQIHGAYYPTASLRVSIVSWVAELSLATATCGTNEQSPYRNYRVSAERLGLAA
jgi:hypothetical protein